MADFRFLIPTSQEELLSCHGDCYRVREVLSKHEIIQSLNVAKTELLEQGSDFILTNFDVFYSVLRNYEDLSPDVFIKAYETLLKGCLKLGESIDFILNEDNAEIEEELKLKMQNVLRMLLYLFTQFVSHFEQEQIRKQQANLAKLTKSKNKNEPDKFFIDKSKALNLISGILQKNINLFWTPQIVEYTLVNMLANVSYEFLQNPKIKQEKDLVMEMFGVFGNLIKYYNYGQNFTTCLVYSIRTHEHVAECIQDGVKLLITEFNCKNLIHNLVKEATEWQVNEDRYDATSSKSCSTFLIKLAALCPNEMMPEVMYLTKYLSFDSAPLRSSILSIITEILIKVLRKENSTEEEIKMRDELFEVIDEHFLDKAPTVRSKLFQNVARLQRENAIPFRFQHIFLEKIVQFLYDKNSVVRKSAIQCVTTYLEYNQFGGNLQLTKAKVKLDEYTALKASIQQKYTEATDRRLEELNIWWNENENDVAKALLNNLGAADENGEESDAEEEEEQEDSEDLYDLIQSFRQLLMNRNFLEVYKLTKKFIHRVADVRELDQLSPNQKVDKYLEIFKTFLFDKEVILVELRKNGFMSLEDIEKLETIDVHISYWTNTSQFLATIASAIKPMKQLLLTTTVSDMHEAIKFFVAANQFQIENATEGVVEMLKILHCHEADRKSAVSEAFKTIYLTTNSKNMEEHAQAVLNRLIAVVKVISVSDMDNFQNVISKWTEDGVLDNSIIDMAWQYYTKRVKVSSEDVRAACEILRMCSLGRETIIKKNFKVVTMIALQFGKDDMLLLASSFRLLSTIVRGPIDINSEEIPFRISHTNAIFDDFGNLLHELFSTTNFSFYREVLRTGLEFIFKVCSKPLAVCETLIKNVLKTMRSHPEQMVCMQVRLCQLVGFCALNLLVYLDVTVYRELKRRNTVRKNQNIAQADKKKKAQSKKKQRQSAIALNVTLSDVPETSELEGAVAEDSDAEFVLAVLENETVSPTSLLGALLENVVEFCTRPDLYPEVALQKAAIMALIKCMLVSSKVCSKRIKLIFSILSNTKEEDIKCNILISCIDLLTRFPNIVEPWIDRIYDCLRHSCCKVRHTALTTLASLILKDMVLPRGHLADIAVCLMDESGEVKEATRSFFERLERKNHYLENVVPDIFGQLVQADVDDENLRSIMKFLCDLIEKPKKIEKLVERFCIKYTLDDNRLNRNITYCLALIKYNEKALKELQNKFSLYRQHVHDGEIYATLKDILAKAKKANGKSTIPDEIDSAIAAVFDVNASENGPSRPKPKRGKRRK